MRYEILSGAHDKFSVGVDSGVLQLTGMLDRESDRSQYSLVVSARDNGYPTKSAEITVTVKVSNKH